MTAEENNHLYVEVGGGLYLPPLPSGALARQEDVQFINLLPSERSAPSIPYGYGWSDKAPCHIEGKKLEVTHVIREIDIRTRRVVCYTLTKGMRRLLGQNILNIDGMRAEDVSVHESRFIMSPLELEALVQEAKKRWKTEKSFDMPFSRDFDEARSLAMVLQKVERLGLITDEGRRAYQFEQDIRKRVEIENHRVAKVAREHAEAAAAIASLAKAEQAARPAMPTIPKKSSFFSWARKDGRPSR